MDNVKKSQVTCKWLLKLLLKITYVVFNVFYKLWKTSKRFYIQILNIFLWKLNNRVMFLYIFTLWLDLKLYV
jgi:hypothetical protein